MKKLYIFADREIFQVKALNGATVTVLDANGWGYTIPLSRVERFCDSVGNHIDFKISE